LTRGTSGIITMMIRQLVAAIGDPETGFRATPSRLTLFLYSQAAIVESRRWIFPSS
jgi:hypothetical protein